MSKRERRVSTRVRGLELNLLERSKLTNKQLVRYALRKYFEEHSLTEEDIILTDINFLQDKNHEYELMMEANALLIEKKMKELEGIRCKVNMAKFNKLVQGIYDIYLDFIDDEDLTDEFRSDLNNFYSYRYDGICIHAMKCGYDYDDAIEYFEKYLDSIFNSDLDDVGVLLDDEMDIVSSS